MARVTYGGGVTEFNGSIGGVTFQKNASGNIAKLRSNPTVNPSALQAGKQQIFAYLVSYWSTLSQANKDLWDAHAIAHDHTTPWGVIKTLSGYQWFILTNLYSYNYRDTIRDNPGAWIAPAAPDQFIIETSATYIRIAWSPNYDPLYDLVCYASLPLRQSSLKLRRSTFFVKWEENLGSMANYDLTSEIEALYNVTWADFYASANCHIIIRCLNGYLFRGYMSSFTSAIIKLN